MTCGVEAPVVGIEVFPSAGRRGNGQRRSARRRRKPSDIFAQTSPSFRDREGPPATREGPSAGTRRHYGRVRDASFCSPRPRQRPVSPESALPRPACTLVLSGITVRGAIVGTRLDIQESLDFATEGKVGDRLHGRARERRRCVRAHAQGRARLDGSGKITARAISSNLRSVDLPTSRSRPAGSSPTRRSRALFTR